MPYEGGILGTGGDSTGVTDVMDQKDRYRMEMDQAMRSYGSMPHTQTYITMLELELVLAQESCRQFAEINEELLRRNAFREKIERRP